MDGTQLETRDDPTAAQPARSRRDFLRAAGLAGATLSVGGVLAACATDTTTGAPSLTGPSFAVVNGNNIQLDFSQDVDVLNYAYALEQLEAAFYTQVVATAAASSTVRRRASRRVLPTSATTRSSTASSSRRPSARRTIPRPDGELLGHRTSPTALSVLPTAQHVRGPGRGRVQRRRPVPARTTDYLTLAGKIVSVEARHASAIRDLLQPRKSDDFAPERVRPAHDARRSVLAAARAVHRRRTSPSSTPEREPTHGPASANPPRARRRATPRSLDRLRAAHRAAPR